MMRGPTTGALRQEPKSLGAGRASACMPSFDVQLIREDTCWLHLAPHSDLGVGTLAWDHSGGNMARVATRPLQHLAESLSCDLHGGAATLA